MGEYDGYVVYMQVNVRMKIIIMYNQYADKKHLSTKCIALWVTHTLGDRCFILEFDRLSRPL